MITTITAKEWMEYKQDHRLKWIALIIYGLFAMALATGVKYYSTATAANTQAQQDSYAQWLQQGKKNPHSAAHYGFYAFKPLSPLAILDKGMESYLGRAVWLEAHNQNEVKEREATDAGSIVRFGNMSVAFIFIFLLPLGILLLGFDLFSKEREQGTLPLLLSSETGMAAIFRGKALALYKVVMLIFLPMLLVATVTCIITAGSTAWLQALPQFLLLVLFLLLYFGIWVLLSLYISSFVRTSSVSLVGLLAFWVLGVFIIPRMGGLLAKALHASPSAFAFSNNVRLDNELGIDRKTPATQRQKLFEDSLLKKYGVDSIAALPLNIRGLNLERGEEYGYLIFEKNYGGLERTYHSQDQTFNWLNILSPTQSLRAISAGFSGTDINKQVHFAALAEDHRRMIASTMNEDIATNSVGIENYMVDEQFWAKIPNFKYTEPPLKQWLLPQLVPVFSIFLWLGFLLFLLKKRAAAITAL